MTDRVSVASDFDCAKRTKGKETDNLLGKTDRTDNLFQIYQLTASSTVGLSEM